MFCQSFIIFLLFFCNSLVECSSLSRKIDYDFNNTVASRQYEDVEAAPRQKWITEIFDEAKRDFSMVDNVTEGCQNDFQLYMQHLNKQSVWAVRMLESSEWPTGNILAGNRVFMGNWFECTRLVSAYKINGQFCFANATYDYDDNEYERVEFPSPNTSAWKALKMFRTDPVRLNRQQLKWALCIPSSCSSEDLKNSLNHLLKPIFEKYQIRIQTDVDPATCSKKEERTSRRFHIFKYCTALYIVILVLCTVYDSKNDATKKNTLAKKVLELVSLRNNSSSLLKPAPLVQRIAHLIKSVAMCFILYAHLKFYLLGYPKYNAEKIELEYKVFSLDLSHSAITDMFFMISGYLAYDLGITAASRGGVFSLVLNFVLRWIRMTVPLGVIIYLIMFVIPYLGDGPLWKYYVWKEAEYCRENWWASIFTAANIFNVERQCFIISWYISVDLHLALVSSILLFIMNKNHRAGVMVTIVVFFLGMIITFAVVYFKRLNGVFMFYISALEDPRNSDDFNYQYMTTYSRIAPYFTGFLAAFGAHALQERNIKLPRFFMRIVFFGSFILSEMYQIYAMEFYRYGREYNVLESATYAATHRWIFVAPFAFALCTASSSDIDKIFTSLANTKIFLIMGRLSFSTFVVNTVILLVVSSLQADLMPISHQVNVLWSTAALILVSYIFGFLFYILLEAPVFNLAKLLLAILYSSSSQKKSVIKTEETKSIEKSIETLNSAVNRSFNSSNELEKTSNPSFSKNTEAHDAVKNEAD